MISLIPTKKIERGEKLSATEKQQITLCGKLLKEIKKDCGEVKQCEEYVPACPACQMYIFRGHLEDYKNSLEY